MDKTLVVVPTFNERVNIIPLVREILAQSTASHAIDVLVVDDSSPDGTSDVVRREAAERGGVNLLERPAKLGLGTAYVEGFRHGIREGYDYIATMDADFSHSPERLPSFLSGAQSADLVIGSRYVAGGGVQNWGLHRRLLSTVANALARNLAGLKPRDCTTGYRLYRTALLASLDLDGIVSHGYSCLMEILFLCQHRGARMAECPIVFVDRRAGQSKISASEIARAAGTVGRLAWLRLRGKLAGFRGASSHATASSGLGRE